MPDYNPDKEGHVPHKFLVQPNSKFPHQKSIKLPSGKELKFNSEKRLTIKDEAFAREIQEEYKKDVVVTRIKDATKYEVGHRYFFGAWPEMPWKKNKENE